MATKVNVFLDFLKSWGWLVFSAIIAVVFSAGQYAGTNGEKVTQLESFRNEQRIVNEATAQKLNDIDRNVTTIGERLNTFLDRTAASNKSK